MAPRKNSSKKTSNSAQKHNRSEEILLHKIGLRINKILFESGHPVEWLSFKSGVARSSIREIIAGRSNSRILTLNTLAKSLGFKDVIDFLSKISD